MKIDLEGCPRPPMLRHLLYCSPIDPLLLFVLGIEELPASQWETEARGAGLLGRRRINRPVAYNYRCLTHKSRLSQFLAQTEYTKRCLKTAIMPLWKAKSIPKFAYYAPKGNTLYPESNLGKIIDTKKGVKKIRYEH